MSILQITPRLSLNLKKIIWIKKLDKCPRSAFELQDTATIYLCSPLASKCSGFVPPHTSCQMSLLIYEEPKDKNWVKLRNN